MIRLRAIADTLVTAPGEHLHVLRRRPALLMGACAYGAGAYAQLLALWDRADAEIPMLEEARREVAATGSETERRDSPASR